MSIRVTRLLEFVSTLCSFTDGLCITMITTDALSQHSTIKSSRINSFPLSFPKKSNCFASVCFRFLFQRGFSAYLYVSAPPLPNSISSYNEQKALIQHRDLIQNCVSSYFETDMTGSDLVLNNLWFWLFIVMISLKRCCTVEKRENISLVIVEESCTASDRNFGGLIQNPI